MHVNPVKEVCRRVKAWAPGVLTVVGGHHATVRPEDFLDPSIDLVIGGAGVGAFREVVVRHSARRPLDRIPGVLRLQDGALVGTPASRESDLDWLAFPVLPTELPLEEFYAELAGLIEHAVSPWRGLAFLRRFPVREAVAMVERLPAVSADPRGAQGSHGPQPLT